MKKCLKVLAILHAFSPTTSIRLICLQNLRNATSATERVYFKSHNFYCNENFKESIASKCSEKVGFKRLKK